MRKIGIVTTLSVLCLAPLALATPPAFQCGDPNAHAACTCGEVNISGATLFSTFFTVPASTNDYIDANCDGVYLQNANHDIQQLAINYPGGPYWWLVQYRGVGSGNGLADFVRTQLEPGWQPPCPPISNPWTINRTAISSCPPADTFQHGTDIGVTDVPFTWFVTQPGTPAWNKAPLQPGYGDNPQQAWNAAQGNKLKTLCHPTDPNTYGCLNLNLGSPDDHTIYDTTVAWVPLVYIANHGAAVGNGTGQIKESDLRTLFTTGRMPNGENLVAATRDSGSGTRNCAMNSICVDPSWGVGDNLNLMTAEAGSANFTDALGPDFQATNLGSANRMIAGVRNSRLAVGYQGGARPKSESTAGNYECLSVQFDGAGGVNYARPSTYNVIHNSLVAGTNVPANPNAWLAGGNETFATLGDPANIGYPMAEGAPKDYINNIRESILGFEAYTGDPSNNGSPGQYLATGFSLTVGVDALPIVSNPCTFELNPTLNLAVRAYTLANNIQYNVPNYGAVPSLAPTRKVLNSSSTPWPRATESTCDCDYPPDFSYSDGTNGGSGWLNRQGGANVAYTANLATAAPRNLIAGDFNGDGVRNINDIPAMMQAIYNATTFVAADQAAGHSSASNPVIVEILGDFNGDGNFDCRDVRYFADGLAVDPNTGKLNRGLAFKMVDDAWFALTGDDNYFNTTIYGGNGSPRPWVRGAAAADVAGNTPWPGARPHGYDCRVDCQDALYIDANFGLFPAVEIDLSCDLNGDLVIDKCDAAYVQQLTGYACPNLAHPSYCPGDLNGDGIVDFDDINPFIEALSNFDAWQAAHPCLSPLNADINADGVVDFDDINPFIVVLSSGGTCP